MKAATRPVDSRPGRGGRPGDYRLKSDTTSYCACDVCCEAQPWRRQLREERKARLRKLKGAATL